MVSKMCYGKIYFSLFSTPRNKKSGNEMACSASRTLEIYIAVFATGSFHVIFWSILVPRKLNSATCSIAFPAIFQLSFGITFGCLKNIINLDFAVFRVMIESRLRQNFDE